MISSVWFQLGTDTLLTGPLETWWFGEACGETLFSGELLRKHWGWTSALVWFPKPVVLLHMVRVCEDRAEVSIRPRGDFTCFQH